jgi:hypothetical protein
MKNKRKKSSHAGKKISNERKKQETGSIKKFKKIPTLSKLFPRKGDKCCCFFKKIKTHFLSSSSKPSAPNRNKTKPPI